MTRWQTRLDRVLPPLSSAGPAGNAQENSGEPDPDNASFRLKLLTAFIALIMLPITGMALFMLERYENSIRANTLLQLENVADKKSQQIDTFITERMDNIEEEAIDPDLLNVISQLAKTWHSHGPQSLAYQQMVDSIQSLLKAHLKEKYYYDLLIMDAEGNVLATYLHESDRFTNLLTGPWKNSNLAQGFRLSRDYLYPHATTMQRYAPSDNKLAVFFIAPIVKDHKFMGAIAMQSNRGTQIPVFSDTTGLGSGETVITTVVNNKIAFTTPLSRTPDNAFHYKVDTQSPTGRLIARSLSGAHGSGQDLDYSNTPVFAAWRYIPNMHAGLIVKIDADTALAPVVALRQQLYFILVSVLILLGLMSWRLCLMLMRTLNKYKKHSAIMYEARNKAEKSAANKTLFLATMSHEISTPMNAIIGMSHLALKTELAPKQHDYIEKIHHAGSALLGIINDILDFSKIEAGKLSIENIEFDLEQILLNVSVINRDSAFGKGLELNMQPIKDLPYQLRGDPHRLEQILNNLVSNAIKFTEYGEISIKISLLEKNENRLKLDFKVTDSGIGLKQEQLQKLFEPFNQADIATTRKYGGSGLGLSISKHLAELMSGEFTISSQPGLGSCFGFTAWFDYKNLEKSGMVLPAAMNNMRVLIVDDVESSRQVLQTILKPPLFKIDMCDSGAAAILMTLKAQQQQSPFDLILMDWQMPGMDGISAAAEIHHKLPKENQPYIVLVTSFDREDVRKESNSNLLDGILTKPVTSSTLIDCMVELFNPNIAETHRKITAENRELRPELAGMRVLLTEDNAINQQIACELMAAVGIDVTVANHGEEALDILQENEPNRFDIILMDIQMPVMDGYEASWLIRRQHHFDHLPIMAMTAHAMTDEKEHCLAIGMNDHISKPIDPSTLFDRLQYWRLQNKLKPVPLKILPTKIHHDPAFTDAENAVFLRLAELQGFSLIDGLNYVGNDKKLYLKLLQQASAGEADCVERIQKAMDNNDFSLASFYAHTLKGVSATFGAIELAELADQVEKILHPAISDPSKAPDADIASLLLNITQGLTALRKALSTQPFDAKN